MPIRPLALLLDTNIVLDVILERDPWADDAASLFDEIARGRARGFIAAHAITTIHDIVERAKHRKTASTVVSDVLSLLSVVPLDGNDFARALTLGRTSRAHRWI